VSLSGERLPRTFGPYVLLESLGAGSFGTTSLAIERATREVRVIKRLRPEALHREDLRARLRHEAAVAVTIDNPHVVRVFDVGVVKESPYVALEYIEGWSLAEVLRAQQRRWSIGAALAIVDGILDGLSALHEAVDPATGAPLGAVHRDISPTNVMIAADGRPVLIDLGLGRSALGQWETRTDTLLGTPGYMSPEQILGRPVDLRADLYSTAVLAFELITHVRYVEPGELAQMLRAACDDPFRPVSTLAPGVPAELDAVLERALAVRPADRFPTARALRAALISVVSPRPETIAREISAVLVAEHAAVTARRKEKLDAPMPESTGALTMTFARASKRAPTVVAAPEISVTKLARMEANVSVVPPQGSITLERPAPTATRPLATRPMAPSPLRRSRGGPILVVAFVAVVAAVVAAVAAAIALWPKRETPLAIPVVLEAVEDAPTVVAVPGPTVIAPTPTPTPEAAPVETIAPRPHARAPVARPSPTPTAAPEVVVKPVPARARLESLIDRASARRQKSPDQAAALDALIAEASSWLESRDDAKAGAIADRLEKQLGAL